jgi:hypothetical protein
VIIHLGTFLKKGRRRKRKEKRREYRVRRR